MGVIGYELTELAKHTGFKPRTIRYYISIGLLPPPLNMGRNAQYGSVHMERLKSIKVMKCYMKLSEIRDELIRIDRKGPDKLLPFIHGLI